ncbi:hypothetical protein NDU88_007347 [Pleurodeles waltl]|uniref:Uncharacterized protein n=1 Tax=Pleurodeles waltl TaxID=8319 RepID=A0AAV7PKZ7_PLEWA|nr:hypothetical protein NDU88_007347 [Pleurodeles waltl]
MRYGIPACTSLAVCLSGSVHREKKLTFLSFGRKRQMQTFMYAPGEEPMSRPHALSAKERQDVREATEENMQKPTEDTGVKQEEIFSPGTVEQENDRAATKEGGDDKGEPSREDAVEGGEPERHLGNEDSQER